MTSMFVECERRVTPFIRKFTIPRRLAMWRGNGSGLPPAVNNRRKLQFNTYMDDNPKRFGLLQLDRDFSHYQDAWAGTTKLELWVNARRSGERRG